MNEEKGPPQLKAELEIAHGVGMCRVIKGLAPADRYRIVTFNSRAEDFSGGFLPARSENLAATEKRLRTIRASGSTALYAGLEMAYGGLEADRTTAIILVTDGVANVGPATHADLLRLHRSHDVRLFTFVVGNSANRPLLKALATESGGFAMNVSTCDDVIGRILQAKTKITREALRDVHVTFQGEGITQVTPAKVGSIYAGQQIVLFGRYSGQGLVTLALEGSIGNRAVQWRQTTQLPAVDRDHPEIERLGALSRIEALMETIRAQGESEPLKQAVIDLGTHYCLVTDYTAMVVLSETDMERLGLQRRNAGRVAHEREAQARRATQPIQSHRIDGAEGSSDPGTPNDPLFNGRSPGIGSGPVGPLFVGLAYLMRRRKKWS